MIERTTTIYIAFDGTEFDNESECVDYEIKKKFSSIKMLTEEMEETNMWELAWYCYIPYRFGLEDLKELRDTIHSYYGQYTSCEPGLFYWSDYDCCWMPFANKRREIEDELERLEDIETRLRG